MVYASGTKIEPPQTRMDIERTLQRYGATSFSWHIEQRKASLQFQIGKPVDRIVRFKVPFPGEDDARAKRQTRERWRALLLCIKAKLESVDSGIESFEEAFLAHVVTPDGTTIYEHIQGPLSVAYKEGRALALPPPQ